MWTWGSRKGCSTASGPAWRHHTANICTYAGAGIWTSRRTVDSTTTFATTSFLSSGTTSNCKLRFPLSFLLILTCIFQVDATHPYGTLARQTLASSWDRWVSFSTLLRFGHLWLCLSVALQIHLLLRAAYSGLKNHCNVWGFWTECNATLDIAEIMLSASEVK